VGQALSSTTLPAARMSLIRVLGRIGGPVACRAVVKASKDADADVKDSAIRALASWPGPEPCSALRELAQHADDETHRVLALRAYAELLGAWNHVEPGAGAEHLAEAMSWAKTADTRKAVLGALARVPHRRALELAMSHLDDTSLRSEAGLAAVSIARALMGSDREAVRAAMKKVAAVSDARIAREARAILAQLDRFGDAITAWQVCGPFSAKDRGYSQLFDVVFEPEKSDAKGIGWRVLPAGTNQQKPWLMDLLAGMPGHQRVAYARTWIHSESDQPARLELGSDDGVKAWLNGELVHANNVARAAQPYTDKADITLKAGWNLLQLKITQNVLGWEFCARIVGRDGKPLGGVRVDAMREQK